MIGKRLNGWLVGGFLLGIGVVGCFVQPNPAPTPTTQPHIITCCGGATFCGFVSSCPPNSCGFEQHPVDSGKSCGGPAVVDGGPPDSGSGGAGGGPPPIAPIAFAPADSQRILINSAVSRATLVAGGTTTTVSLSGVVNQRSTESGSEITRIELGLSDATLAGVSLRSGYLINNNILPLNQDGAPFAIPAAVAHAATAGLVNNVPSWGLLSSPNDLFGSFDGVHWSLSGTMSDPGRSLTFQLSGTAQPFGTDTDGDGVPDVTDNCPLKPNPTQAMLAAPKLIAPPPVTITSCTSSAALAMGRPTVTDVCGAPPLTVINDAPAVFPLGTTTVTWRATDGAGNGSSATQLVTVALGDDPSCCPAGTNIIMGTSNNDVLNGTPGRDCIIGLGAQDVISGGGGDDYISGGEGDDILKGGAGNDYISGGNGQDHLEGGDGNDTLNGSGGDDSLNGGNGTDICSAGGGHDTFLACETVN
jgi:hypothetical protein